MNKVQKIRYPLYLLQLSDPTIYLARVQLQDAGMPPHPMHPFTYEKKKWTELHFIPHLFQSDRR